MGMHEKSQATRQRIIAAAGRLFAECGRDGVTVRDIVKKACTHLSALNYHFKSKDALYRQVLLDACKTACLTSDEQSRLLRRRSREAIVEFAKIYLSKYSDSDAENWQMVVIARESWSPSPVFREVVRKYFAPETAFITKIIAKTVGSASLEQVQFAAIGMIGLLETFGLYGHLINAIAPNMLKSLGSEALAKRIANMTINAAKTGASPNRCYQRQNGKHSLQRKSMCSAD